MSTTRGSCWHYVKPGPLRGDIGFEPQMVELEGIWVKEETVAMAVGTVGTVAGASIVQ